MSIEIHSEGDSINFVSRVPARAIHLVRDAIDDIADQVETKSKELAPMGETGALKAHPVDRDDVHISEATQIPLFGGGVAQRGAGGRFVSAGGGNLVAESSITVAKEPKHAIWVHNGTGIYGPRHHPIEPRRKDFLHFRIDGREFFKKSVRGQPPQPFLDEAYVIINNTYVPLRIERLRLEIRAIT